MEAKHVLKGKKVILGVTGGIAAYKAVDLASRLRKREAEIRVVMTEEASSFVTPLTFQSISGNPVHIRMFEEPKVWNVEHIALAEYGDLAVIAPATANILAKAALGIADDYLSTVLLAFPKKIVAAPAMNQAMYRHPATQQNLRTLKDRGVLIVGPAIGYQACGTSGEGRMSEPAEIISAIEGFYQKSGLLAGKRALVTAGGTREAWDPVRYLGNRSSGKMGYAVAEALSLAGAEVVLISGPTEVAPPAGVECVFVESAEEMRREVLQRYDNIDIVVKAAAVADYRPLEVTEQKIKRGGGNILLELVPNPDILAELGRNKKNQVLIGFAAETRDVLQNGREKLRRKNADLLVVNDVTQKGAGFGSETNIVSFLDPDGGRRDLPLLPKKEVALELVNEIAKILSKNRK